MCIMTDSMLMPSPRSPIGCGGIGASIHSAGGAILIMVGVGAGTAGTTRGIIADGLGITRTGIIRGIRGRDGAPPIIGAMPIRLVARLACGAEEEDVRPCHAAQPRSSMEVRPAARLPFGGLRHQEPRAAW